MGSQRGESPELPKVKRGRHDKTLRSGKARMQPESLPKFGQAPTIAHSATRRPADQSCSVCISKEPTLTATVAACGAVPLILKPSVHESVQPVSLLEMIVLIRVSVGFGSSSSPTVMLHMSSMGHVYLPPVIGVKRASGRFK